MNSKKPNKEEAPEVPKFAPAELAERLSVVKSRVPGGLSSSAVDYEVARVLYEWDKQAHHYGAESFKLTEAQFLESLKCAMSFPCVRPLPAAVPPIIKDKFKNFTPKGSK